MAKARKEIDKDSMYQKIMPSAMRSIQPAEEDAAPVKPAAKKAPTRSTPRKTPAKVAPAATPVAAEELPVEIAPEAPPPARRKAAPPVRGPVTAEPKASIVNIMELLIDEKVGLAMDKFHCCTCDKCRQDITAMALNKLHPKYIVSEPELLADSMADKESNMQVTTALVQAILKVKSNPKHE